jgi:serine/threonine-protein kinase
MKRALSVSCLAVVLVAAAGSPARAQSPADVAAAEALFRDGRKLFDDGRYAEACPKFAESQRLAPAPGTLLNLAGCYEKQGLSASAWATFKDAASEAHRKGRQDWEQLARDRATALEPKLSHLTVTVPDASAIAGLTVRRDGEELGRAGWGTAIPVDPGQHVVEATAPGHEKWSQTVQVDAGAASASVTVPALGESATTPATPESTPGSTQRTLGLVVGGVGIVGIGIGSFFGVQAMNQENDAKTHCRTDTYCTQQGVDLGNAAKTSATVSTVAFIAGGAALAAGVVLYFMAPKRKGPAVGLSVGPGSVGLGVGGAW